jgi:hypothetical protein
MTALEGRATASTPLEGRATASTTETARGMGDG